MQHKNTKTNNYLGFIYLFILIHAIGWKNVFLSIPALVPLLLQSVKKPRGQSHFAQKPRSLSSYYAYTMPASLRKIAN